jgi:uncharacterized protein (TIGR03435 family)
MNWKSTRKAIRWSLRVRARGCWRCAAALRGRTSGMRLCRIWRRCSRNSWQPVTDATGLKGRYEFTLSWMAGVLAVDGADGDAGPDLFAALQLQLGLKLEASKEPVEALVIDYLEKEPIRN